MANGLPEAASNVASIPEVVVGLLYNPSEMEWYGNNINYEYKKIKIEMINKGIKQSSFFTWRKV